MEGAATGVSESSIRFALLLLAFSLCVSFAVGYFLKRAHIHWFPEAAAGMIIGTLLIVELFVELSHF
jgi:hypothetical protein